MEWRHYVEMFVKTGTSWVGAVISVITLSRLVMFCTLVYTVLQIYVLWRDKVRTGPPRRRRR